MLNAVRTFQVTIRVIYLAITRIVTWNVRTAISNGKLAQIVNEIKIHRLKILWISKMRWTGSGNFVSENTIVMCSSGGVKRELG